MSVEQWSDLLFSEAGGHDAHVWGSVKSVNDDGSYQVQLNASSVTTRCAAGCTAGVGDRVLVCIMANGRCVAVGRLEGTEAVFAKPVTMQSTLNVSGNVRLPNNKYFGGASTEGTGFSLLGINTNDNVLLAYGPYFNGLSGGTYVYGTDAVGIRTKGEFNITSPTAGLSARAYGVNKVLWSGGYYMSSSHTATLSEEISAQPNGVLLVFSTYSSSTVRNYGWVFHFVPKYHVSAHDGTGCVCCGCNSTANVFFNKYLYVSDTQIVGHDNNTSDNTMDSGITKTNTGAVLRYVIGV